MTRVYYKDAVGAFVLFDVTRSDTFDAVARWKADLDTKVSLPDGRPIPAVLIGNKADQPMSGVVNNNGKLKQTNRNGKKDNSYINNIVFFAGQMDAYCKDKGFEGWFATSARDNTNVEEAAEFLVKRIIESEKWKKHVNNHNHSGRDARDAAEMLGSAGPRIMMVDEGQGPRVKKCC